jgi:hypothetical protein
VDFTDGPTQVSFPCSTHMGVVFCSNDLVLEKNCAKTLEISSETLACVTAGGEKVIFGKIDKKSYFEDFTKAGTGAYNINYSSRVHLKEFKTPNGNFEYQVVVE